MEFISVLEGVTFALLLAAFAVSPQAIATYFELRAEQHDQESAQ